MFLFSLTKLYNMSHIYNGSNVGNKIYCYKIQNKNYKIKEKNLYKNKKLGKLGNYLNMVYQ